MPVGGPPEATPICATAWVDGTAVPPTEATVNCIAYPYGTTCAWYHVWHHPQVDALVHACYPRPF